MAFQDFSYIVLFCLYSHIAQAHLYGSSNNISTPLEFLNKLSVGVKKGDNAESIYELKKYLSYLGYLTYNNNHQNQERENIFDDSLEIALRRYQEFYDLNITGFLDDDTIAKMRKPRCDMPDIFTSNNKGLPFHTTSYYSFFKGHPKWSKKNLSYTFDKNVDKRAKKPLELALADWASVTPFKFYFVTSMDKANIKFSFVKGEHGDGRPFTHRIHGLAHAFAPPDGRVHFNAGRKWNWAHILGNNMRTIATHELGHALGLSHSKIFKAIMYPLVIGGPLDIKKIQKDDIDGINALYNLQNKLY